MGDTSANPLFANAKSGGNIETELLGPSYSYTDHIPGPSSLGVGSNGTFSQLGTNASAIGTYVSTLIDGDPPLGNQYFVNTGGTCTAPDGSTQPRYNYVNNKPNVGDLLPASMSDIGTGIQGLIPGVIGDIESLNPLYLVNSLLADAVPACECYKCTVTDGASARFLTTSLSPDFDPNVCAQVDISQCLASTESFENMANTTLGAFIPTMVAGVALAILLWT
jgi:hypothetical protein